MLKSYEAIYKQGQLIWLTDTPPLLDDMPVKVVTHFEEPNQFTPQAVETMLQRTAGANSPELVKRAEFRKVRGTHPT